MQLPEACTDLSTTLRVVLQGGLARMTTGTSAGLAGRKGANREEGQSQHLQSAGR